MTVTRIQEISFREQPRMSNSTPSVDGNFTRPNEEDGWIGMSNNSVGG